MNYNDIPKYCIHLEHRTDRLPNMRLQLDKFAGEWNVWPGEINKVGAIGIGNSIKKLIKYSKDNNYEMVHMFEDDVIFPHENAKERWVEAIENAPEDWDILLGGVYYSSKLKPINDWWQKTEDFCALHCTIFRNTSYDHILNHNVQSDNKNIDRYMGKLSKEGKLNVYVAWPMVAVQLDGYSDNVKKDTKYSSRLKSFKIYK